MNLRDPAPKDKVVFSEDILNRLAKCAEKNQMSVIELEKHINGLYGHLDERIIHAYLWETSS